MDRLAGLFANPIKPLKAEGAEKRSLVAAATEDYSCEFGSAKFYLLCAVGGALSCGTTHTAMTPLDLVKCRIQVNKEKYKSIGNGFKVTMAEGGAKGLVLGWAPTAIGYTMQGICKFGFYEFFKNIYSGVIGEENTYLYRTSLYLAASASAEFFADIALSPMESVKVGVLKSPRCFSLSLLSFFRSECRPLPQAPSQPLSGRLSPLSRTLRELMGSTSPWFLCGADRSPTQ